MLEKVREEIEGAMVNGLYVQATDVGVEFHYVGKVVGEILSIKLGSRTLKELIERYKLIEKLLKLYDEGKLVKDTGDELPEIPCFLYDEDDKREWLIRGAINYSKMLAGFKKVEPLQPEGDKQ